MKEQSRHKHLKRRRLRFSPFSPVLNLFPGEFPSVYKGDGEDFVDLRPYQPGDDAKIIHWPHYAKTRELFVIERVVPKNLTIVSAVDLSQSMYWSEEKIDIVDAFFAILIKSLVWSGSNSLSCLGFSGEIEGYFPPRAGKEHFNQLLKWYLGYSPQNYLTNIPLALDFLVKKVKPRSVVFFISDFLVRQNFDKELRMAASRFDFVPVVITDPKEFTFFPGARVNYRDQETGDQKPLWLTQKRIAELLEERTERQKKLKSIFKQYGLEPIFLESSQDKAVVAAIHNFFERRLRLIRKR